MSKTPILLLSMIALASATEHAVAADDYPVSGRWTYNDASAPGPAADCRGPTMEFRGAQRFDARGGISQFRNVRVEEDSPTVYRVLDEFFNVQVRGRMSFTLRIRDSDHLEIEYDQGGASVALRRCA